MYVYGVYKVRLVIYLIIREFCLCFFLKSMYF